MFKTLFARSVTRMERQWNYDTSYMRDLLAAGSWTFFKFTVVTRLTPRKGAPLEAVAPLAGASAVAA